MSASRPRRVVALLVPISLTVSACAGDPSAPPDPSRPGIRSSFEGTLDGFTPRGIDLELAGGEIEWLIEPSTDRASHGSQSLKVYLNNVNDAGKVFVERAVQVDPDRVYDVVIRFQFGTRDWGQANLFRIIAGVLPASPSDRAALAPAFQGDTGHGGDADAGYVWVAKEYVSAVTAGSTGRLYLVVGIWGTWEGPRTYYVDDLRVKLVRRIE